MLLQLTRVNPENLDDTKEIWVNLDKVMFVQKHSNKNYTTISFDEGHTLFVKQSPKEIEWSELHWNGIV